MNQNPDSYLFIYIVFGAISLIIAFVGNSIQYYLKKDLDFIMNHFDLEKIDSALIENKNIDNDKIVIPFSILLKSFKNQLESLDIFLKFIGAFGIGVFLLSIGLLISGFTYTPTNVQFSLKIIFGDYRIICSIAYILCFIFVLYKRFHISNYKNHISLLKIEIGLLT